jgi:CDP-diacylglycerol---glycerol-3-phosphate 3-phosphatidyltransferase
VNLANWITVARIALVPVFLVLAYRQENAADIAALIVFAIASASDRLDGQLARRRGTVSRLGEFLDPTADKLLIGAALVVLVDLHEFPLWAAIVIAVREVAITVLRTRVVAAGGTLPASAMGKLKTGLQVAMVCWWLYPAEPGLMHWIFLAAGVGITVASGIEYLVSTRVPSEEARV